MASNPFGSVRRLAIFLLLALGASAAPGETSPPPSSQFVCSPDTCGEACSGQRRLRPRGYVRQFDPPPGEWAEPQNYANAGRSLNAFIAGEVERAYDAEHKIDLGSTDSEAERAVLTYPPDMTKNEGKTTSNFVEFKDEPATLAVSGLFGCSATVVVSKRGAWIAHHWEEPNYRPRPGKEKTTSEEETWRTFHKNVLDALGKGLPKDDSDHDRHRYGLRDLRGMPNFSRKKPHQLLMQDDAEPQAFLFVPYKRPEFRIERGWGKMFPQTLKGAYDEVEGGSKSAPKNWMVENEIRAIFGRYRIPIEKVYYRPRLEKTFEEVADLNFGSERGKVLIQYQPAKSLDGVAAYRVWFEGEMKTPVRFRPMGEYQVAGSQGEEGS